MRRKGALFLLVALFVALLPAPLVVAAEPWQGAQIDAEVRFGAGITFILHADTASAVQDLELYFQLGDELARNRVEVEPPTGRSARAEWVWELQPGEIPPGRTITYWWRATTQDGAALETDRATAHYNDERFSWEQRQQGNIALFWYGQNSAAADRMMRAAQDALQRLEENTGVELQKPVRIFLYNSKSDMSQAIPSRSESYDAATVTLGMAMGGDTIVILASASGADRTVAHELSHVVIGYFTDNPYGGLPTWLDEGLAMYAEGTLRGDNASELERAIRSNTLISVRSLSGYPGDASLVDLFYAECYSVVNFLIEEYGPAKMDELLRTFAEGVYQEDALQRVYGFGLDELEDKWRAAIDAPPRPTPAPPSEVTAPPSRGKSGSGIPICSSAGLVLILAGAVFWRRRATAA